MIGSLNYTRIITSLGMIVFLGAIVAGGTGAFFNDTETSTGNLFRAGALDLKVDSVGHVNGLVCYEGEWTSEEAVEWSEQEEQLVVISNIEEENDAYNQAFPANVPQAGDDCASTWTETDLGPEVFFNFADLKPGDHGENTISLHVYDNDAYACAIIDDMQDNDNGLTEPEEDVDSTGGDGEGELSQELRFFAWSDDGDNIWEEDEQVLFSNTEGPASDVIDGVVYPLFTPQTGVLQATTTEYIGLYWCYGAISTDNNELSCDGSEVTNLTQTDSLEASFTFYVEQARNNAGFECPALGEVEPDLPNWTDEGTREGGLVEFVEDDTNGTVLSLTTTDSNPSRVRWTNMNLDQDLADITVISFDSKVLAGPNLPVSNASMRLFIDLDGDTNTADVQEIVYEPYYNIAAHNANGPASIVQNIWQTWPAHLGLGKFWANGGFLGATPNGGAYATNFTLQQVLDAHANAKIVGVSLGMGTWNPSQVVLVDNLLFNGVELDLEN